MLLWDDVNNTMEGVLRLCDTCLIIYLIFELLSIALPLRPPWARYEQALWGVCIEWYEPNGTKRTIWKLENLFKNKLNGAWPHKIGGNGFLLSRWNWLGNEVVMTSFCARPEGGVNETPNPFCFVVMLYSFYRPRLYRNLFDNFSTTKSTRRRQYDYHWKYLGI